jgi:regulation of enolase protein 1 (concanavalin A-like superfamily)
MESFSLAPIPSELQWRHEPKDCQVRPDGFAITAPEESDCFIDPAGTLHRDNAPAALFEPPDAHFILSARVTVDFAATFDAGVLFIYQHDTCWAKLCFEYSPQRKPMIVSVVTKGTSDDCNSLPVEGQVYLRAAVTPQTVTFHYSQDARYWQMVRYFSLGEGGLRAGFLVQSPTGAGCRATFSEIRYRAATLRDNRSGE